MIADMKSELKTKLERVRLMMAANNYDTVHIAELGNLSWILCGADLAVSLIDPPVAEVVVTGTDIVVLASNIEEFRLEEEELPEGVSIVYLPWFDESAAEALCNEYLGGRKVLSDSAASGFDYRDFWALRVPLLPEEVERYRRVAADSSEVFTDVLTSSQAGISEYEIQGRLLEGLGSKGLQAVALMVAGDERLERYKHPLAKNNLIQTRFMAVACTRKYGLISNISRLVSFAGESPKQQEAYKDLLQIEAALFKHTQHGMVLQDVFTELKKAYAIVNRNGVWKAHHQGGPCGYYSRDFIAQPNTQQIIVDASTYAWNPSLPGLKVEDTVLLLEDKLEILTQDKRWPYTEVAGHKRPAILEL